MKQPLPDPTAATAAAPLPASLPGAAEQLLRRLEWTVIRKLDGLRQGEHASSVDWDRIEQFRPFGGIRIEDDVVCTQDAPINLTRDEFAATA